MANKPARTPTKTTTPTDDSPSSLITTIKKSTCKNLQASATLGYEIGIDEASTLWWKVSSNTGNGYWSQEWVRFTDIQKALADWDKELPITSMALRPLLHGKSVNTQSFLLATLVNEGLLEPIPDSKRHYQLTDAKPFLAELEKLKAAHSNPSKGKPRAKAKAAAGMPKATSKPATGK